MSGHTPGPWKIVISGGVDIATVYGVTPFRHGSDNDDPQAWVSIRGPEDPGYISTNEEQDANARLIAAAPELLRASQLAEPLLSEPDGPDSPWFDEDVAEALSAIRAAIAKAEGRS